MSNPICKTLPLWPYWFISNTLQAFLFLFCLAYVYVNYWTYVHTDLSSKIGWFVGFLVMRSLALVMKEMEVFGGFGEAASVGCVRVANEGLYVLFYFMVFKMRVIQMAMWNS